MGLSPRPSSARPIAAAAATALLLLLSACANVVQPTIADFSPAANDTRVETWLAADGGSLDWRECRFSGPMPEDSTDERPHARLELECALMSVPVDWFAQDTGSTSIPVTRVRATGEAPLGDIVVNPGGPGASGTESAVDLATRPGTEELTAHFNLVGFDPRGVAGPIAGGDPLECTESAPADCAPTDRLALHASSAAVAHDMEYLRVLLGDAPLNYLGYSYGTYLGAISATLFPAAVGAMALDGTTTADDYSTAGLEAQTLAFAASRERFLTACLAGELGECPLSGSVEDAEQQLTAASEAFAEQPVDVGGGAQVDGESIDAFLGSALYGDRASWPSTAATLAGVLRGDERSLDAIASESFVVSTSMNDAVVCSIEQGREGQDCASQPLMDPAVAYSGAAEILVFAVTGDPATPYSGAQQFVDELGNATLVTVDGEGHGASYGQSACASEIATRYFVDGSVPVPGARCAADVS